MKIPNWIGKKNDDEKTYEIKKKTSCNENKKTIDEDKLESLRIEIRYPT